jgi:small-conductance mechanosensitive channel
MDASFIDRLVSQIEILLVYLERPVIRRQLLVLALITIVSWVLGKILERLIARLLTNWAQKQDSRRARGQKWQPVLTELTFPLLGILLLIVTALVFENQSFTAGLLWSSLWLFGLFLVYRLVGVLLSIRFGQDRARYYRWRIMLPIFIWILLIMVGNVFDLQIFSELELFSLSGSTVTLGQMVTALFVFYLFLIGSSILQDILRSIIMPRTDADLGVINSILAVTRYFMIMIGLLASLGVMGFSLSTLAVIGGGLSVGIGIGLQDLISNFIAGILLIFEQSLRPGDVIEVKGEIGTVEKLSIRSTVVRTLDNVELIVPNNTFLTDSVKTYTKSNRLVRIPVEVGVSYGSDVHLVHEILMNVAHEHEMVRNTPAPVIFFNAFGESSLNFQLNVWVDEPIEKMNISSALHFAIWDAFKQHGVEIPFPQRDLHLRGGWEKLTPESRPEAQRQPQNGES